MDGSPFGVTMSDLAIISTCSVFLASSLVFALGKFPGMKIDRPGAAIIGAVLMFMTGTVQVDNSLHLIHFGTIVLLFSMMLVVAYLHLAGFFDWVTELVVTRLKPHHLLPTVIFLSGHESQTVQERRAQRCLVRGFLTARVHLCR